MSFDADETNETHERRITRCRSCRAQIIWLPTAKGKNMPCDAHSVQPDDDEFEQGRHVPHWSTCPNADQHRRSR